VATFIEQGVTSKAFDLTGYVCLVGPTGSPQGIVERLSELMVEAGKSERVRKMLDTFGIDESAQGHVAFKKMYDAEKPVWIEVVSGLGLTPQ
jgi:tripartite-type tricarboxylate transporter receptor subunit TctC